MNQHLTYSTLDQLDDENVYDKNRVHMADGFRVEQNKTHHLLNETEFKFFININRTDSN